MIKALVLVGLSLCFTESFVKAATLYGISFGMPNYLPDNALYEIDPTNGTTRLVGKFDSTMSAYDLATRNGTDLFTFDQVSSPNLIRQHDPATGHTLNTINIGTEYLPGEGGIAFRSDGVGFLSGGAYPNPYFLYTFTESPGSAHLLAAEPVVFEGLAFSPTGVLYGLTKSALDPTGESRLMIIDQTSGALTVLGGTGYKLGYNDVGGLAFAPTGRYMPSYRITTSACIPLFLR